MGKHGSKKKVHLLYSYCSCLYRNFWPAATTWPSHGRMTLCILDDIKVDETDRKMRACQYVQQTLVRGWVYLCTVAMRIPDNTIESRKLAQGWLHRAVYSVYPASAQSLKFA